MIVRCPLGLPRHALRFIKFWMGKATVSTENCKAWVIGSKTQSGRCASSEASQESEPLDVFLYVAQLRRREIGTCITPRPVLLASTGLNSDGVAQVVKCCIPISSGDICGRTFPSMVALWNPPRRTIPHRHSLHIVSRAATNQRLWCCSVW